jgi:Mn-dependent DtxR family transcriptional regulator
MGRELQAAYDAYRPGMNHHMLARCLQTTPSVAGQLLKLLQVRGLIDAAGNKTMASPQEDRQEELKRKYLEEYAWAIAVWHELEEKKLATVRDFAAQTRMGETKAWELLRDLNKLGLIHWERRRKKELV